MDQQPRTYRIRLFEDYSEKFRDRPLVAVLDFSPGPGLRATQGQLDALVTSLAYASGARGAQTLKYRLSIFDAESGAHVCDWPATTWHEK